MMIRDCSGLGVEEGGRGEKREGKDRKYNVRETAIERARDRNSAGRLFRVVHQVLIVHRGGKWVAKMPRPTQPFPAGY